MVQIDTSDFKRLADEYKGRIASMRARPLGDDTSAIQFAVKDVLKDVLMDNEGVTLGKQYEKYSRDGSGYYGSGREDNDMAKVNPQEWIYPSGHILGKGRLYGSSDVAIQPNGSGAIVDLYTLAEMQPYPNVSRKTPGQKRGMEPATVTYALPQRPIMEYFRKGWIDPLNPNHRMEPRPFGERVAKAAAAGQVIGKFIGAILRSAGFRQR